MRKKILLALSQLESSADNLLKTIWTQIVSSRGIQNIIKIFQTDGIPERVLEMVNFEQKKIQLVTKSMQNYPACRV